MTVSAAETARRRAALRRIRANLAIEGHTVAPEVVSDIDDYARGLVGEDELLRRTRERFEVRA